MFYKRQNISNSRSFDYFDKDINYFFLFSTYLILSKVFNQLVDYFLSLLTHLIFRI